MLPDVAEAKHWLLEQALGVFGLDLEWIRNHHEDQCSQRHNERGEVDGKNDPQPLETQDAHGRSRKDGRGDTRPALCHRDHAACPLVLRLWDHHADRSAVRRPLKRLKRRRKRPGHVEMPQLQVTRQKQQQDGQRRHRGCQVGQRHGPLPVPAIGLMMIIGAKLKNATIESAVASPVVRYAHSVSAKPVIAVPTRDTTCPNQTMVNAVIPCGLREGTPTVCMSVPAGPSTGTSVPYARGLLCRRSSSRWIWRCSHPLPRNRPMPKTEMACTTRTMPHPMSGQMNQMTPSFFSSVARFRMARATLATRYMTACAYNPLTS